MLTKEFIQACGLTPLDIGSKKICQLTHLKAGLLLCGPPYSINQLQGFIIIIVIINKFESL